MGRCGCTPLLPPTRRTCRCGGEEGIAPPPPPVAVAGAPPLGEDLGLLVLLCMQPLTLPHCPLGGGILLCSDCRRPCPPIAIPQGLGGDRRQLMWTPPPPPGAALSFIRQEGIL